MKKLFLLICAVIIGGLFTNASAQYAQDSQTVNSLKYSFGNYKNEQGQKISKTDLRNYFDASQYQDYEMAHKKFVSGLVWTGVGVGLVAVGSLSWTLIEGLDLDFIDEDKAWIPSSCLYFGGLVCAVIGIPKAISGNTKLKRIANEYNEAHISYSLGLQQNGFGLALAF
jgi:hypothetical protein